MFLYDFVGFDCVKIVEFVVVVCFFGGIIGYFVELFEVGVCDCDVVVVGVVFVVGWWVVGIKC